MIRTSHTYTHRRYLYHVPQRQVRRHAAEMLRHDHHPTLLARRVQRRQPRHVEIADVDPRSRADPVKLVVGLCRRDRTGDRGAEIAVRQLARDEEHRRMNMNGVTPTDMKTTPSRRGFLQTPSIYIKPNTFRSAPILRMSAAPPRAHDQAVRRTHQTPRTSTLSSAGNHTHIFLGLQRISPPIRQIFEKKKKEGGFQQDAC